MWVSGRVIFCAHKRQCAGPHRGHRRNALPYKRLPRAGDGARTRDIKLGRLVLYQLSYSRIPEAYWPSPCPTSGRYVNAKGPAIVGRTHAPYSPRALPNQHYFAGGIKTVSMT
jgi:hypothetical protein